MRLHKRLMIFVPSFLLVTAACGSDGDDGGSACGDESFASATRTQYVVNSAAVPVNSGQAIEYALDIDGDERALPDNQLGMIVASLAGRGFNGQEAVDEAIVNGDVILLVDVEATDLTDGCGKISVFIGDNANPAPCTDINDPSTCGNHLDGTATFDIAAASPRDTQVVGTISNGRFFLGKNDQPGNFTIEFSLVEGQPPLSLDLIGAKMEIAQVSSDGLMNGIIGGAVKQDDLVTTILPTIHGLVEDAVTEDCSGAFPNCCDASSVGLTIVDIFDEDDDCAVSLDEITNNTFISSFLIPDIDLLDGAGGFAPNTDGIKDSLSIGLGFSTTTATFSLQ